MTGVPRPDTRPFRYPKTRSSEWTTCRTECSRRPVSHLEPAFGWATESPPRDRHPLVGEHLEGNDAFVLLRGEPPVKRGTTNERGTHSLPTTTPRSPQWNWVTPS